VVQNTTGIGAIATTGSNIFTANQTITGSLFISQNLIVQGSSSVSYISQSTLNIGTNIITMNTNTPGTRFGGIEVIDSGSSPLRSGSLYFDSINDQWIFVHQNTAGGVTSSVVIVGPQTFNNIGNETLLTQNRVLKSNGLEHVTDSQISDNGVTVSITNGLSVGTNLTASSATISGLTANQAVFTDANDTLVSVATTGTGDVVRAGSPTITGTLTAANITGTGTILLAGIYSSSTQVDYNSIQNKLSGVVSSSTQVQPLLPGGTVSSSGQVAITGTSGYSTFSSSIATKNDVQDVSINALNAATSSYAINATIQSQLANVVSSSAQVKPLLPGGTVSSSGQVDITATTNYSTFSSSLATVDAGQTTRIDNLASLTSSYAINATIQSQLAGVASSSAQVKAYLPNGTVTSSAQYPGWVTASSQIDYNSIQNKLSGVVSSSTQVQPLLPAGTVSSSGQVDITTTSGYSTFSSSLATVDATQQVSLNALNAATSSYAINSTIQSQLAGVVSSSTQVQPLLPGGTVSSSAQVVAGVAGQTIAPTTVNATNITASALTANQAVFTNGSDGLVSNAITGTGNVVMSASPTLTGTLTAANITATGTMLLAGIVSQSSQIDYNSITNKLSGVVSSSAQVKPLLPGGTVSSSAQVQLNGITGTTFATADFTFPQNLTVAGTLTAEEFITEYVSASVIYESGSSKFGDTVDDVMSVTGSILVLGGRISGSMTGMFSSSAQVDYNSIQNKLSGVVSSSTQVQPLLPGGTVSSSGQVDYNSITNKLSGVYSSSAFTSPSQGTARLTLNGSALSDVDLGLQSGDSPTFAGLTVTNAVSATAVTASGLTANQAVFTNASDGLVSNAITGTGNVVMSASPTLTGTVTAANITATGTMLLAGIYSSSTQIDYNSIQNKLSGVVSSSAQVKPLLPGGSVSSSTASAPSQGTVRITINGNNTDVDTGLQTGDSPSFTGLTVTGLAASQAVFTNGSDLLVSNAITGTGNVVMSASPTLTGTITADKMVMSGSQFSGIVSGSGTQYRFVVPVGTNLYAT
jgi:hypothetical protein